MSSLGLSRQKSVANGGGRARVAGDHAALGIWLAICVAVGLACGLLGWAIGSATQEPAAIKDATAAVRPGSSARGWAPDITTAPFGTVNESTAPATRVPNLPFTVLRTWNDQGQPAALLERDGQRFMARGLAVHGDYLIRVEGDQVVFTFLPSAPQQRATASTAGAQPSPPAAATSVGERRVQRAGGLRGTTYGASTDRNTEEQAESD